MKEIVFPMLGIVVLALSGCAASGKLYKEVVQVKPPKVDGVSRVVVLRPNEFAAGGRAAYLFVGEKEKRFVSNGGFVILDVVPAKYSISVRLNGDNRACELDANLIESKEDYYFEIKPNSDLVLSHAISAGVAAGFSATGKYGAAGVTPSGPTFDLKACKGFFFIYPIEKNQALKKLEVIRESE
ncbi:hypothetical protein H8K35_07785 [Undibacterium sp. LX40W]|uniref:DUF2846 domain-containing protein n=1 Tax=Undibacterium nitidum TaxID=2762298 RepID=A0A923HWW6_9BURK|nr:MULTISPECIES: hypothetical protein [Undibacterium]MBC3881666.1 hypothetical protein [Undibacterium nitidum]MBC3891551.1 hypothetical protein [Undibacterium sp. LX40W]